MRLSPEARSALRRAISNHPNWDVVRKERNLSLAQMRVSDFLDVAAELKINVEAIATKADNEERTPRPSVNPKAAAARNVFEDDEETPSSRPDARVSPFDRYTNEVARRDNRNADREPMFRSNGHDQDKMETVMKLLAALSTNSVDENAVREIVREEMAANPSNTVRHVIEITRDSLPMAEVDGQHPMFPKLLRAATARDVKGYVPNIWLAGPAGSGKTFAASKVAECLELEFHYNGAIGMAHELLGFIDANGEYHRTPFRDAYENGGVYLFDEVDGSDNSALLALNAALANGIASFPDGKVARHKDCIVMAAANTWGFGATADYVGRAKLDAAFLSRFPVKLAWNYDEEMEQAISGNPAFAQRVQKARAAAKSAGLKVLIDPRATIAGAALINAGFTEDEAAEMTYLANLSDEQKRFIR